MKTSSSNIPDPKRVEKELSDFLSKKFGDSVKIISPLVLHSKDQTKESDRAALKSKKFNFDLKPHDLISYLNRYLVRQDDAKAILATKVCTHFNRIQREIALTNGPDADDDIVGRIKSNILMIGPTGVGKTYMIKLIAHKIGVPFVKGDATKFSETGYVGGDVEDLVRDLVHEADDDIEKAQYGIIYIDEIDKIAASQNLIGADISRTGVQRALLKPMEETEVELKVPHDPIAMMQAIERYRKTGSREKKTINTKNILFIMSGAFGGLSDIITKRIANRSIGFGGTIPNSANQDHTLKQVSSKDLIAYGFESEFVGRLPLRAIFDHLSEADLFKILKNPNNPIILSKKMDFAAYGIRIKFNDDALRHTAKKAYGENTGARGLVSAMESALLPFEKSLPETAIKKLPVTLALIRQPGIILNADSKHPNLTALTQEFDQLALAENTYIRDYLAKKKTDYQQKYSLTLTPARIKLAASYYTQHVGGIGKALKRIKYYYDEIKRIELYFYKTFDMNIVLEESAVDFVIGKIVDSATNLDKFNQKLTSDFSHGLKLVREKTSRSGFFISRAALQNPEKYIRNLLLDDSGDQRLA